jgi:hypothetical protein
LHVKRRCEGRRECQKELNADRVRDHRAAGRRRGHEQEVVAAAGSPSSGRGSDSRAAVMQCGEGDDADEEVESSYTGGPLDTMDTLQDALPRDR